MSKGGGDPSEMTETISVYVNIHKPEALGHENFRTTPNLLPPIKLRMIHHSRISCWGFF